MLDDTRDRACEIDWGSSNKGYRSRVAPLVTKQNAQAEQKGCDASFRDANPADTKSPFHPIIHYSVSYVWASSTMVADAQMIDNTP